MLLVIGHHHNDKTGLGNVTSPGRHIRAPGLVVDAMAPDTPPGPPGPPGAIAAGRVRGSDRRYLVGLASRLLGDPAAAEDIVQDALGRLARVPPGEIDDVRGWLAVAVRRLSINHLRSAYSRHEIAAGALPPELVRPGAPRAGGPGGPGGPTDPADRVTLDDQVGRALALLLDRLTPAERTAFVLHDVFGFPFDDVAEIVGRTPAACRQLASRARRALRAGTARPHQNAGTVDPDDVVVERFIAACGGGDITELMAVLDPAIVGEATLQGHGPLARLEGAPAVAAKLLEQFGPPAAVTLVPLALERHPGVVALTGRGLEGVLRLDIAAGNVHHIHTFVARPGRQALGR
jgi:RNA polymerase sigma-70 factor (ECF subfamily)